MMIFILFTGIIFMSQFTIGLISAIDRFARYFLSKRKRRVAYEHALRIETFEKRVFETTRIGYRSVPVTIRVPIKF